MAIGGVVASEFHKILADEEGSEPPHRFMTTVDWPDRESFERGFYDSQVQAELKEDLKKISDWVFLVSERLIRESKAKDEEG